MKKTTLAIITILAPLMFAQTALANDKQAEASSPLQSTTAVQTLTKNDILQTTQNYQLVQTDHHQPRRSALFAQILDTAAQRATLATAVSPESSGS